jgi:hypothetical protein
VSSAFANYLAQSAVTAAPLLHSSTAVPKQQLPEHTDIKPLAPFEPSCLPNVKRLEWSMIVSHDAINTHASLST